MNKRTSDFNLDTSNGHIIVLKILKYDPSHFTTLTLRFMNEHKEMTNSYTYILFKILPNY